MTIVFEQEDPTTLTASGSSDPIFIGGYKYFRLDVIGIGFPPGSTLSYTVVSGERLGGGGVPLGPPIEITSPPGFASVSFGPGCDVPAVLADYITIEWVVSGTPTISAIGFARN